MRSKMLSAVAAVLMMIVAADALAFVPSVGVSMGTHACIRAMPSLRIEAIPVAALRRCCRVQGPKMLFFGEEKKDLDENSFPKVATFFPAVNRIVAVGDVHGDVNALKGCMKIANLIDDDCNWIGGETHFVQIGDILDRGDQEKDCLDVLLDLQKQAADAGGMVHVLLGNHEIMNVDLDFRYVTPGAWDMWGEPPTGTMLVRMKERFKLMGYPEYMRSRINAFKPGGSIAKKLATMQIAIQIGDTVLVHGGLRKKHIDYGLERLNGVTKKWLEEGVGVGKPAIVDETDSPVWARLYSVPGPTKEAKEELQDVLQTLGASRMIVGHTPQLRGINSAITEDGYEVWRCDTGMSSGMMSGPLEAIEVLKDGRVNILTKNGIVNSALRSPDIVGDVVDVCDLETNICTPAPEESRDLMLAEQVGPEGYKPLAEIDMVDLADKEETSAEVSRLREIDDASQPAKQRLKKLVEKLIADAVERDDKTLTKKSIREILSKVVGRELVNENRPYVYETVDKIVGNYVEAAADAAAAAELIR